MVRIAVILVLPIEYNNSSMIRCKSIISAFYKMGHYVRCYCPFPDENSKYFSKDTMELAPIDIVRYGKRQNSFPGKEKNLEIRKSFKIVVKEAVLKGIRRVDVFGSTLKFLPKRKCISSNISKGKFDFMISFSDPMPAHMIGKYCKKHNKEVIYIQQWGDPLASDTISKTSQPVWFRKIIEKSLLKPADRICYVSPFTLEEQRQLFFSQAQKMIFLPTPSIPNGRRKKDGTRLCIGYFGSYNSAARNIMPFYEAANNHSDVNFYIVGDSDITLENKSNITIMQRLSPNELQQYMQEIDVIVCIMNKKGNQIPGKVYHDASSSKDILFIKDGEYGDKIQAFFENYNHYTFANNTVDSISNAIKKYASDGVPERKSVTEFLPENIAARLIEF